MTWPGWEQYSPEAPRPPAKRHKYAAEQCFVTDDLTLFTRADVENLALRQGVAIERMVGLTSKRVPLARLALELGLRGIVVASKREARRWIELRQRERLALIANLRRQVPYELHRDGVVIAIYVADAVYVEDGTLVVEDSKGHRTREYLRKKRLFEAEYQTKIRET